jgi:hypothetical protein
MQVEITDGNSILEKYSNIQLKYKPIIVGIHAELDELKANYLSELELVKKNQEQKTSELNVSKELLSREIYRYGELLKEKQRVTELTGLLKVRFQELEDAISEFVNQKLKISNDEFNQDNSLKEKEYDLAANELKNKLLLIEEELNDELDVLVAEWETYQNVQVNKYKGTCNPSYLVNFTEPSYQYTTSTLAIGKRPVKFDGIKPKNEIYINENIPFVDTQNIIVVYDKNTIDQAEAVADVLLFRTLYSNLPDKLKIHIFDKNLHEKFREFLPISNLVIEKGFEWDQFMSALTKTESLIRSKLGLLWADITANHSTIYQYNLSLLKEEKYDDLLPYTLFVFDDFLSFYNENYAQEAFVILDRMIKYGCNGLILVNKDNFSDRYERFVNQTKGLNFKWLDLTQETLPGSSPLGQLAIENISNEDKKTLINNYLLAFENLANSRAKIKFKTYAIPEISGWFNGDASKEVKVPIGKSVDKEGFEFMAFKTKDMLSNALLCGGVGSGKTNFLKGVISSLALNYSPEDIELWLVDMKNGAGFSIFNNLQLPHATKYAFSAESELINDLFSQLKKEMDERYAYFTRFSVDNLEDAKKLGDIDPSKLRRIVLIIDEFASIFTEDAPFIEEIAINLLLIIQKGRAMGINLLLAAQNFNNIKSSAFTQAVSLIPTRILLKSSPEAASSILGYSNKGYVEITKIGQGLINNNFGEINNDGGNYFFKSFLLDNEDLEPILNNIKNEVSSRALTLNDVKFIDASLPAMFEANAELFSQNVSIEHFSKVGIKCHIGESYLINDNNYFGFDWKINGRHPLQNILITGNERQNSIQTVFSILSSISYGIPEAKFMLNCVNALDEETTNEYGLDKLDALFAHYEFKTILPDQLESLVKQLETLLEARRTNKDRIPVFTLIIGIEQILQLHKMEYLEAKLTTRLKNLLSVASNYGIYFVIEINKPKNLEKISRDLLGFIEHRICFWVNAEESHFLLNNKLANQLINSDTPNIRNKAIYQSQTSDVCIKFKSYSELQSKQNLIKTLTQKVTIVLNNEDTVVATETSEMSMGNTSVEDTPPASSFASLLEKYPNLYKEYNKLKNGE